MKNKSISADGQNIAQMYKYHESCRTMQVWTAVSPKKKIYNRSFVSKAEIAVASVKKRKSAGGDSISTEFDQAGGVP